MSALPVPRTTTDQLLVALHDEIVGLRADLAASRGGEPAPAPPQQLLEEPKTPKAPRKPTR